MYIAGTCQSCGEVYETEYKTLQNFDLHSRGTCKLCTNDFCGECQFWCDCCDKKVCRKCTAQCVSCGERTCTGCLTNKACSFCATDEDARMEAVAASIKADHDAISRFSNATWFCLAAALIGAVFGGVYWWTYRPW